MGYTGGKKIKNNSTIRLKKGIFTFITADFKNTKTKRVRSVRVKWLADKIETPLITKDKYDTIAIS